MKRAIVRSLALVPLVLGLSSCAWMNTASEPEQPAPATSTLDGAIVSGDGVTIRELRAEEYSSDEFSTQTLIRQDEVSFILEYGGSGSSACASNFTTIERSADEFTLTHAIGDGSAEICTDDYRFTYFLVETDEPVSDSTQVNIISEGKQVTTLAFIPDEILS